MRSIEPGIHRAASCVDSWIPRCAIAHLRFVLRTPRNDGERANRNDTIKSASLRRPSQNHRRSQIIVVDHDVGLLLGIAFGEVPLLAADITLMRRRGGIDC